MCVYIAAFMSVLYALNFVPHKTLIAAQVFRENDAEGTAVEFGLIFARIAHLIIHSS